jgi:2-dehydropantoate 2-reductase
MQPIKRVMIVGLGAIGSIYAVKFAQYDPANLLVLVDEERYERYQREGICFNGVRHDFHYILPSQAAEPVDLILFATKSQGLAAAITAVQPFVHPGTLFLSLLNGISAPALIAAHYGWEGVLHAFFIGHGSTRIGNSITFDHVGTIVFGKPDNTLQSEPVQRVADVFTRASIDYQIPPDMLLASWRKFVVNVGINQASAILRADYGTFQQNPRARHIAIQLMEEAIALAQVIGIQQTETLLPWSLDFIDKMRPTFKSSMLQDVEAGRTTEVDLFGGAVCALGEAHGVATPMNRLFLKLIQALEPTA